MTWLTNNPAVAQALRQADEEAERALSRVRSLPLSLSQKLRALSDIREHKATAYRDAIERRTTK